jgi:hypothetical protein
MNHIESERSATAADLVDLLSAYENELIALEQGTPGLAQLREAVGLALAQASFWLLECEAEFGDAPRTTH